MTYAGVDTYILPSILAQDPVHGPQHLVALVVAWKAAQSLGDKPLKMRIWRQGAKYLVVPSG